VHPDKSSHSESHVRSIIQQSGSLGQSKSERILGVRVKLGSLVEGFKSDFLPLIENHTPVLTWRHIQGGSMKLGPGLTFSWKRALGVTKAKRAVSKSTGIPLSRSGRRNKLGRWMGMK
jgi:hypothetical protein